jgi:hypothetical protein
VIELGILTVEDLTLAIKNCVNSLRGTRKIGLSEDEAYDVAYCVLNFFGYSDRIIDNVLESGDRSIFYELEDIGILSTEREETTLYDGREWRIHYWLFKRDEMSRLIEGVGEQVVKEQSLDELYRSFDKEWERGGERCVNAINLQM